MPEFSTRRNISEAENKLRVLFCLNALGMANMGLGSVWTFGGLLTLLGTSAPETGEKSA